ncbi:hypothetical protein Tco_0008699 [Tanacetum coccineum]
MDSSSSITQNEKLYLGSSIFKSCDDLLKSVCAFYYTKGYGLFIRDSKKDEYVSLQCDRSGAYRNKLGGASSDASEMRRYKSAVGNVKEAMEALDIVFVKVNLSPDLPLAALVHPMGDMNPSVYSHKDEGSTSAKRSGGYMPSLLLAPRYPTTKRAIPRHASLKGAQKVLEEPQVSVLVTHGGGQRCQKPGCSKGAESRTAYCKAHGGGRRCQYLGCTKSAEGRTKHCIAHGGGRRCGHESGCTKAARGKSGLKLTLTKTISKANTNL